MDVQPDRAVRIARARAKTEGAEQGGPAPGERDRSVGPSLSVGTGTKPARRPEVLRLDNSVAFRRSHRLFWLGFVLLPLLIWGTLVGLIELSPYAVVRSSSTFVVELTAALVVIVLVGIELTLERTPRSFQFDPRSRRLKVARVGGGRPASLKLSREAYQAVLEVYPAGFLNDEEVELVEVLNPPSRRRRWVVERRLLDPVLPRHPRRGRGRAVSSRSAPGVESEGGDGSGSEGRRTAPGPEAQAKTDEERASRAG